MRLRPNVDVNSQEIMTKLRQSGVTVEPRLAGIGHGVPDLLCGFRGVNILLEVKRDDKGPAARNLTADEQAWHEKWGGQVAVVANFDEAMDEILAQIERREA